MLFLIALLSCAHRPLGRAPTPERCQGGEYEACHALAAASPDDEASQMLDRWACLQGYAPSCKAVAERGLGPTMVREQGLSCARGDLRACALLTQDSTISGQFTRLQILPGDQDGPLAVLAGGSVVQVAPTAVTLVSEAGLRPWPNVAAEGQLDLARVRALHATADGRVLAAAIDPLVLWSLGDGATTRMDAWPEARGPVVFSADGRALAASMAQDAGVAVWALPDGRPLGVTPGHANISELILGPEGDRVAISTSRGWFTVAPGASALGPRGSELEARAAMAGHPLPERAANRRALSRDGRRMALVYDEGVAVVDMDGATLAEATLPKILGRPTWSPDGGHLAVVLAGGAVAVLTLGDGRVDPAADAAILAAYTAPPTLPAAGAPQIATRAEQRGVVTLRGAPAAGAEVTATPCTAGPPEQVARTAEDGSFTLNLPRGCWALVASGLGALPANKAAVRVGEGTPLKLGLIATTQATGTVKGRDGKPAAGVEVRARLGQKAGLGAREDTVTATEVTDATGRFTLSPVRADGFRVEAIGADGAVMEIWEDPSKPRVLSLATAVAVRVIRDPNATRDPELWVAQGGRARKEKLAEDLTWITSAVSAGEEIKLWVSEGGQSTPRVTVTAPGSGEILLQGPAYGQLEVRLPERRPGDHIWVYDTQCPMSSEGCKTGWIPAGTYQIVAHDEDHRIGVSEVEVKPEATTVVDAPLSSPTGAITGRVVNAEGRPLAAVSVSMACGPGRKVEALTGPDGRFRLEGVLPSETFRPERWQTRLDLEAPGWHPNMQRVQVQAGGAVDMGDLTLYREE